MGKYIFTHPFLFAGIILLGILSQGTVTAISFFMMFVVDTITSGDMGDLVTAAYIGAGVVLLFFVLIFANTRLAVFYVYKTSLRLKNDLFAAILNIRISEFNQSNSAKHISLINNDIKLITDKYINGLTESAKFITTIVFALAAMAYLSPVNALIALALSSSPMVLPFIFGKKLAETNRTHMEKLGVLNEKVKDFFHGFEVIKTFGIEGNVIARFSASAKDAAGAGYRASAVSVKLGSLSGTFMVAANILTYLVAGYFVITGSITVGAVIAIAGLNSGIVGPMQYLSFNLANIKSTKDIRKRLLETMDPADSRIRDKDADFTGGIAVKDLSFSYNTPSEEKPAEKKKAPQMQMIEMKGRTVEEILADLGIDPSKATIINGSNMDKDTAGKLIKSPPSGVLKNISYTFKHGGKYAVVGGSGSGKSTLLRLLMGYYDDYTGQVSIGGHEIRDINRESLYRSLAMMHQSVFMLDDTLRNNITLYNPYTGDEYENAVKKAKLYELDKKMGSSANIGEGGNTLSGGERQRVAIARAIIKGSEVLLMDEATSNLDNETAFGIEKALVEMHGVTSIFVTHRYTKEILQKCDGILVLRDGELVESGTFDELYERKDCFYSLYTINS